MVASFRTSTLADIPFITGLLCEFYAKAGGIYRIPFCEMSARLWVQAVMERGVCLVGPSSCAGALLIPFQLNNQVTAAYVEFWCFRQAREIGIFDALKQACCDAGAQRLFVSAQVQTPAIRRYYLKKGLQQCAAQFSG